MSVFDSKINFRNNQDEGVIEKVQEEVDFALKMRNAVDVQLIDTNLYMSKELWLPWGSRGAFGGQVSWFIQVQRLDADSVYIDCSSSIESCLGHSRRRFCCACKSTLYVMNRDTDPMLCVVSSCLLYLGLQC